MGFLPSLIFLGYDIVMNLILLPGNTDQDWIKDVERVIGSLFDKTYIQTYRHHERGQKLIDLEHELAVLKERVELLKPYTVFAKSVGIVLAVKGIKEGSLSPEKCIFVGTPVNWTRHHGFWFEDWLVNYSIPTLFIQQQNDPFVSSTELRLLLEKYNVTNCTFVEIPGDTHHYENLEELKGFVSNFLKS